MTDPDPPPTDPYARSEYRRLIAWDTRIRREEPFLRELLESSPDRSVLDVGCGTGEHVAFFSRLGARAVGVDCSESMLDSAKEHERKGEGRFLEGDALRLAEALGDEPRFGLAICLGNMLPHVLEDGDLDSLLVGVRDALVRGGQFLLQILNYARILEHGVRHLPINFRDGDVEGEEIVFVRLMKPAECGRILFFPTTLSLDPDSEEPVRVARTRRVELRAWTADDLRPRLERLGFDVRLCGDMRGGEFLPADSQDLVVVARRSDNR